MQKKHFDAAKPASTSHLEVDQGFGGLCQVFIFGSETGVRVEALVERFEQICLEQDQALLSDKTKSYNKLYDEMEVIRTKLSAMHARAALRQLLEHPNTQVKYQTAMATLAVAPVEARRVIEAISKTVQMPYAANARETLRNLDSGLLKPP